MRTELRRMKFRYKFQIIDLKQLIIILSDFSWRITGLNCGAAAGDKGDEPARLGRAEPSRVPKYPLLAGSVTVNTIATCFAKTEERPM